MPEEVIETPALSVEEKTQRAEKLIAEAKKAAKDGITDGQNYDQHVKGVAEAQRLMTEVRSEKQAKELSALNEVIKEAEREATAFEARTGKEDEGLVTSVRGLVAQKEVLQAQANPQREANPLTGLKEQTIVFDNDEVAIKMLGGKQNIERLARKDLVEGTTTAGGYLVVPAYLQDLFAALRYQGNAFRKYGLLNIHPVSTSNGYIPKQVGGSAVSWVNEGANKTGVDPTFSQVPWAVNVLAGLARTSLQLEQDSNPSIQEIITTDLASNLGNAEEVAIWAGTGNGQPTGILNQSGVQAVNASTNTGQGIIDNILDAITLITTAHFVPDFIAMHNRRLSFLQKSKDSQNNYLFNSPGTFRAPGGLLANQPGMTSMTTGSVAPQADLFGIPIIVSTNAPTNIDTAGVVGGTTGAATRDAIVVGVSQEIHWFQRQEMNLARSEEAEGTFAKNQAIYRLEERVGMTVARYPQAFAVLAGSGLVP